MILSTFSFNRDYHRSKVNRPDVHDLKKGPNRSSNSIPWNYYNVFKVICTASLVALALLAMILLGVLSKQGRSGVQVFPADYVAALAFLLAYSWSLALLVMSLKAGRTTSPAQFLFYFATVVCTATTFRSIVLRRNGRLESHVDDQDAITASLAVYTVHLVLDILMFFLNFLSDRVPPRRPAEGSSSPSGDEEDVLAGSRANPRQTASFISKMTFAWATPLMWRGYRAPLEPDHLWEVDASLRSKGLVPIFDHNYFGDCLPPAAATSAAGEADRSKAKTKSVLPALVKSFGTEFFLSSILKALTDVAAMVAPQVMKLMIDFVSKSGGGGQAWKGYLYGGLLLATTVVQSLLLNVYFEKMFLVAMNVRTVLISVIYRKAFRMSNTAKRQSTVGEVVNLMSVDVQRFMDLIPYLNMVWSAPLQIALCCYFMYVELGPAIFAGIALMVVAIPANAVIATYSRRLQLDQMKNKDQRIKLMNEILGGVKVIKLYGWEMSFIDQVQGIRNAEITVLKKAAWLNAVVSFIWSCVPFMVAVLSFTVYVFLDGGQVLDPDRAFVTMSYLNILRMPLAILPFLVVALVQATVSLQRVNKYMNNEEVDPLAVTHDNSEQHR